MALVSSLLGPSQPSIFWMAPASNNLELAGSQFESRRPWWGGDPLAMANAMGHGHGHGPCHGFSFSFLFRKTYNEKQERYFYSAENMVVYLMKGMQEQQAQIEALQSEINTLKGG